MLASQGEGWKRELEHVDGASLGRGRGCLCEKVTESSRWRTGKGRGLGQVATEHPQGTHRRNGQHCEPPGETVWALREPLTGDTGRAVSQEGHWPAVCSMARKGHFEENISTQDEDGGEGPPPFTGVNATCS